MNSIGEGPDMLGGMDPIVGERVTGWTRRGSRVTLMFDNVEVSKAVADRPRLVPAFAALGEVGGFSLELPAVASDGNTHSVRVLVDDGTELGAGGRLFRAVVGVSGRIDECSHGLIRGHLSVEPSQAEEQLAVAALVGDEVVALAVARKAKQGAKGKIRPFSLILPDELAAQGHRIVHVAVLGGPTLEGSPAILPRLAPVGARIRRRSQPVTLAIKIAAPSLSVAQEWGDYHFARQLGAALQRRGWVVRVDCADEWARTGDAAALVLRGRHRYRPAGSAINMMWQISHPDRLAGDETRDFDHIFVASDVHARTLARLTPTPVSVLHQASDPEVFRPPAKKLAFAPTALFVGNSRKEYRTIVRWCIESGVDVGIFGSLWEGIIPSNFVRGIHIMNENLHEWYGSCSILLNDHWDTMRDSGFLSNRLFDGSAAGAFIITDPVRGLAAVFGDAIETAESATELKEKVEYYTLHTEERLRRAAEARRIVLEMHTFDHRAAEIIGVYEACHIAKNGISTASG